MWQPCSRLRPMHTRRRMVRTVVLGTVAGTLIAWNWLRLENAPSQGQAALIVLLAVVPAILSGRRTRLGASLAAFLLAAGSAFAIGPGLHYPSRLLSRFGHGFLDFYDVKKPVAVSYVWNSDYSGLTFPRKKTVVLKIKAPTKPQYWRAVALNDVIRGRWIEDGAWQEQSSGYLGEPGLVPPGALPARRPSCYPNCLRPRPSTWVEQQVTVEAL